MFNVCSLSFRPECHSTRPEVGECRLRPLLYCATTEVQCANQCCLVGTEIFRFIDECFNPSVKRHSCLTRYNFLQWGYAFTPLIEYFKNIAGQGTSNLPICTNILRSPKSSRSRLESDRHPITLHSVLVRPATRHLRCHASCTGTE